MSQSNHTLPEAKELFVSDEDAYKANKYLAIVNRPVHSDFLKRHPTLVNKDRSPYWYLPIDKVEWLLTRIYGAFWKREILTSYVAFNAAVVVVRLHFCIPGTDTWLFHDGIGSAPIQMAKGANAADLSAIKHDGTQKAFPSALSYALSNAASRIGKIFGSDLNKEDPMIFMGANMEMFEDGPAPVGAQPNYNQAPMGAQPTPPPVQQQAPSPNPAPVYPPAHHPNEGQIARDNYYATPQYQTPAYQPPQPPQQQVQQQAPAPQQQVNPFLNPNDL